MGLKQRRWRLPCWTVAMMFAALPFGGGHDAVRAAVVWPNSEGGRHVRAFFDALSSGEDEQLKALLDLHYAPGATQGVDEEVKRHQAIREQLGTIDVRQIEQRTPSEVTVWGWSDKLGLWMQFVFTLEAQPPHRIRRMAGRDTLPPTHQTVDLDAAMSLDEMARQAQKAMAAPALAIAVFHQGLLVDRIAIGLRAHGGSEPITVDDLFHLGSITKSMTATALADLVEDGVLSWSSRLGEVVRDLDMQEVYRQVTLANLLHHRAGIVPFTDGHEWPAAAIVSAPTSRQEKRRAVAAAALQRQPVHPPGTAMVYSNAGYVIAAIMAETASGQTWEELMRDRLLTPWKLASCGFGWPVTRQHPHQPHGHFGSPGHYRVQQPGDYETLHVLAPAGDLHCTVTDLGRYGVYHLNGMRTGTPTLQAKTVTWLHTPPREREPTAQYAAGWVVTDTPDGTHHQHNGSGGTFYAQLSLFPERDLVVAVVTNCGLHARPTVETLIATIADKWRRQTTMP